MNESVQLRVEKEWLDKLYEKLRELGEEEIKAKAVERMRCLKKVAERTYRVYNKSTDRFHNLDLGTDEVI